MKKKRDYSLNQLYVYLTEGCNLACRHCWLSPGFETTAKTYSSLPVELFETAVMEAKPLGLSGVKLTGGEPLLHPEFLAMLKIIRREELSLTIETNGMLCTPDIASEIAKSPNRFVSVSMDGVNAETHDWIRGVSGSFKHAQAAVRNLAAVDTPPQIIMSVMRRNADQMSAMIRLAQDLGASSLKFNVVQPTARGELLQDSHKTLTVEELIRLGHQVDMELSPKTSLDIFFDYPMAFRPLSRIARRNGCSVCGVFGILGIMPTGHYALCGIGKHIPELVFGMSGKDRLEAVWKESPVLNTLREGLPKHLDGVCARCLVKYQCLGACIAQNYYRTGSLWGPFWFCETAEKQGLFPKTRILSKED